MSEEKKTEKQENPFAEKYNRACDRLEGLAELTEEAISAIISLHLNGVSFKKIQQAWALPACVLTIIIGAREKKWEG